MGIKNNAYLNTDFGLKNDRIFFVANNAFILGSIFGTKARAATNHFFDFSNQHQSVSSHSSNYLSDASCHVTKQFANSTNQLFRYKYNLAQKVKTYSRLFRVFGSMAQRELNVSSFTSRKLLITCKISRKYSI